MNTLATAAPVPRPHESRVAFANSRFVSQFETTMPEEAVDFVSGVYGPHALRLASGVGLDMQLRGFEFASLHLGELRYGSPVVAGMARTQPYWYFGYLRRGVVQRSSDGASFTGGEAGVIAPDMVQELAISADAELLNLRVQEHDLKNACRALLGSDLTHPLRFVDRAPANAPQIGVLLRIINQLAAIPIYPHEAAGRLEARLRDAALYELLLAWPNSYAHCLDQPAALPASTRRARDFIHANATEVLAVADIARACGVGVRALARGFEKHLNTSPLRYLQQYRLDRVRDELLAPSGAATVTDIAFKWGFMQLGSFAARYRLRFGESPSQTLRRARH